MHGLVNAAGNSKQVHYLLSVCVIDVDFEKRVVFAEKIGSESNERDTSASGISKLSLVWEGGGLQFRDSREGEAQRRAELDGTSLKRPSQTIDDRLVFWTRWKYEK